MLASVLIWNFTSILKSIGRHVSYGFHKVMSHSNLETIWVPSLDMKRMFEISLRPLWPNSFSLDLFRLINVSLFAINLSLNVIHSTRVVPKLNSAIIFFGTVVVCRGWSVFKSVWRKTRYKNGVKICGFLNILLFACYKKNNVQISPILFHNHKTAYQIYQFFLLGCYFK